jgi:hypothetical protein
VAAKQTAPMPTTHQVGSASTMVVVPLRSVSSAPCAMRSASTSAMAAQTMVQRASIVCCARGGRRAVKVSTRMLARISVP